MKMSHQPSIIPRLCKDEASRLDEYRKSWSPWIAQGVPDDVDFIEASIRRWTVRGHGSHEVMRATRLNSGNVCGIFELPDCMAYLSGRDFWAATYFGNECAPYPIGRLDVVDIIGSGWHEKDSPSSWVSSHEGLVKKWTVGAPVDTSGRVSPMELCEYIKSLRQADPTEFAWRQALHHQQTILRAYDRALQTIHSIAFRDIEKWEPGQSFPAYREALGVDRRIEVNSSVCVSSLYLNAVIEETGMAWFPKDVAELIAYIKESQ